MFFVLVLTPVLWIDAAYAGSSFKELPHTINVIEVKSAEELEKIMEQIRIAKAKSAHALSKDEIEKIKIQAAEAVDHQMEMVVEPGASVFVGSQVVSK